MNCFSSGREVRRRWRSVPSSSVTKYLEVMLGRGTSINTRDWTDRSSSGEMNTSFRLMIWASTQSAWGIARNCESEVYVLVLDVFK
jgi:hypothetical protein